MTLALPKREYECPYEPFILAKCITRIYKIEFHGLEPRLMEIWQMVKDNYCWNGCRYTGKYDGVIRVTEVSFRISNDDLMLVDLKSRDIKDSFVDELKDNLIKALTHAYYFKYCDDGSFFFERYELEGILNKLITFEEVKNHLPHHSQDITDIVQ